MPEKGDFSVSAFEEEFVEDKHQNRSERSKDVDMQKRAPVTTNAEAWANDPDGLDFPGVDTPKKNPNVLPKDLKDPNPTNLSPMASGETPPDAMGIPSSERNTGAPVTETARLAQTDVSLAPEEAFEGVGATSSREMGGFNSTYGGEESPLNETTPPDIKRGETPADAPQDDKGIFYQAHEDELDLTPTEFKREVRRKKRDMKGMVDEFGAAGLVVEDYTD